VLPSMRNSSSFPPKCASVPGRLNRANENSYNQRYVSKRELAEKRGSKFRGSSQVHISHNSTDGRASSSSQSSRLGGRTSKLVTSSIHSATRLPRPTLIVRGPWLCVPALRPVCHFEDVRLHVDGATRSERNHFAPRETTAGCCFSTMKPRSRSRLVKL
jgi:hypothetical protein